MIVISGALVLVALILLIIGVVGPDLAFVYASIAVSLVSLVFLVIGILQRRGEPAVAADGAPAPTPAPTPVSVADPVEGVTAVIPSQPAREASRQPTSRRVTEEPPVAASVDAEPLSGGSVLVVEGRPRYHVEDCRYLTGKTPQVVEVTDAREEGFTPCGVCRPDDALAARTAAAPVVEQEPVVQEAVLEEPVVEEDVPGVEVAAPARRTARTAKAPARKAPAKAPAATPAKAPAKAPRKAADKAAEKAPAKTSARTPSKAAAAAAAGTPAAATAAKRAGSVVVIPERGKYHRAECRFVRDAADAEVLSKTAATRQGYTACGVCKP